jgi:hypothetical protein
MTTNREMKCQDAIERKVRAGVVNLSDDPLADLISQPGSEVLLYVGRPQPQWVRADLHIDGGEISGGRVCD